MVHDIYTYIFIMIFVHHDIMNDVIMYEEGELQNFVSDFRKMYLFINNKEVFRVFFIRHHICPLGLWANPFKVFQPFPPSPLCNNCDNSNHIYNAWRKSKALLVYMLYIAQHITNVKSCSRRKQANQRTQALVFSTLELTINAGNSSIDIASCWKKS